VPIASTDEEYRRESNIPLRESNVENAHVVQEIEEEEEEEPQLPAWMSIALYVYL
jgi:hypothetical protein